MPRNPYCMGDWRIDSGSFVAKLRALAARKNKSFGSYM